MTTTIVHVDQHLINLTISMVIAPLLPMSQLGNWAQEKVICEKPRQLKLKKKRWMIAVYFDGAHVEDIDNHHLIHSCAIE